MRFRIHELNPHYGTEHMDQVLGEKVKELIDRTQAKLQKRMDNDHHESDLSSDVIIMPGEGIISDTYKIKGSQPTANSTKRTKKEENKGILTEIEVNEQSE
ncbi:hypothetical protein TSAR_000650, partial [Trichomalopsis sarcophagae]